MDAVGAGGSRVDGGGESQGDEYAAAGAGPVVVVPDELDGRPFGVGRLRCRMTTVIELLSCST